MRHRLFSSRTGRRDAPEKPQAHRFEFDTARYRPFASSPFAFILSWIGGTRRCVVVKSKSVAIKSPCSKGFFLSDRTPPFDELRQAFDKRGKGRFLGRNETELTEEQQDEATMHASV